MPHAQHLSGNNPANDPDLKPVKNRSKFTPNRSLYQTMIFGLNTPHFAMECVEGDNVSVRVGTDFDTYTLKAPLMTPVKMHKDYFYVPFRAILPNNAPLIVTNPLTGDDVVASLVNCGMDRRTLYTSLLSSFISQTNSDITYLAATNTTPDLYQRAGRLIGMLCNFATFGDLFFSRGSLLNVLGHGNDWLRFGSDPSGRPISYDMYFDSLALHLSKNVVSFQVDLHYPDPTTNSMENGPQNVPVICSLAPDRQDYTGWSLRYFFEQLRQGALVKSIHDIVLDGAASVPGLSSSYAYEYYSIDGSQNVGMMAAAIDSTNMPTTEKFISLSRLVAYHLASIQFYTSDTVDYIYSTNLWHNNQRSLLSMALHNGYTTYVERYTLNGTTQMYDTVSAFCVNQVLNKLVANQFKYDVNGSGSATTCDVNSSNIAYHSATMFLHNIFSFTRSLKFRDYFVGSKVHPLAVGNTSVAVSGGYVDVVDVTRSIQVQRFLNQVNRVGRTFKEYIQGIFGVTPMTDAHDVIFLGHTTDNIGAEETANTGQAQMSQAQSRTSTLRMDSSKFAFEGQFSEPGILIGITNFDVVRPYVNSVDRAFYHEDRFDMFNPFLQNVGDQAVYGSELENDSKMELTDFGYQLRYSEYKQSFDRAVGGFIDYLPGYAFLNSRAVYGAFSGGLFTVPSISPDFIRSRSCEFDRFYLSLTHFSLAGYFHFILRNDIIVSASRPMEAAPSIL